MNPIMLTSFIIPAFVAFGLIALLIKERYNLFPKNPHGVQEEETGNQIDQKLQEYKKERIVRGKRYPEDFVDFSGGNMGI